MGVFVPAVSWPWDNQNTYETEWRDMAKAWSPSAVQADDGGELAVSGGAGLSVQVAAGAATVSGHRARLAAATTLQIAPNGTGSTRVDRVVMRADLINNRADVVVLGPLPSGGSAAPGSSTTVLQRSTSVWDIPLASVSVGPGASTITAGNIIDERLLWSPETGLIAAVAGASALTVLVGENFPGGVPEGLQVSTRTTAVESIGVGAAASRSRLDRYVWDESTASALRAGVPRWQNLGVGAANSVADPTFPPQFAVTDTGIELRGRVRVSPGFGGTVAEAVIATLPPGARPARTQFAQCGGKEEWLNGATWTSPSDAIQADSPQGSASNLGSNLIVATETGDVWMPRYAPNERGAVPAGVYALVILDGARLSW